MKFSVQGNWMVGVQDTDALRQARRNETRGRGAWAPCAAPKARYHLYASYACPFAHRTQLAYKLYGLSPVVTVSFLHPDWSGPDGWVFAPFDDAPNDDPIHGARALHEVYAKGIPDFTGKVTVPAVWDRTSGTLVSIESAQIVRGFRDLAENGVDLYPAAQADAIDELTQFIHSRVGSGVYAAGFAATQSEYDCAIESLFAALDALESRLEEGPYLMGGDLTEADVFLLPTLARFDAVYQYALKCSLRRLVDYPRLSAYAERLMEDERVASTVRLSHAKRHYFAELEDLVNPRIIPRTPPNPFQTATSGPNLSALRGKNP
ncbi:MAG: glutathione S-transferase C-terminal domain-containing protein [Nannocystales bacterium]